jgi:uncharacterized protein YggE
MLSRFVGPRTRTLALTALLGATTLAVTAGAANAQIPDGAQPFGISATGLGEVKAAPDRATILFSVETRSATAAEASQQNATRQTAVLAALRAAGLAEADVGTVSYTLQPDMVYDEPTRRARVAGYVARNTVRADVREIVNVGRVIDAAIRAGANEVSSLQFETSRREELRIEALQLGMRRACREAAAIAGAAGGTLGRLLQASATDSPNYPPPSPMPMMRAEAAMMADTPVAPRELTLNALVLARWEFLPAGTSDAARSGCS